VLSVLVFVLGSGLAPVPTTDEGIAQWRLSLPPKIQQFLAARFVSEVTTTVWGHGSFFSSLHAIGTDASATIEELRIPTFNRDLARPFDIGRGWTCGVGAPPKFVSHWFR
jgi:hypothetical protein